MSPPFEPAALEAADEMPTQCPSKPGAHLTDFIRFYTHALTKDAGSRSTRSTASMLE
jgi:hypothetical protein